MSTLTALFKKIDAWTSKNPLDWNAPILTANEAYALRRALATLEGLAAPGETMRERLRAKIDEQDAARGRSLTDRERLENLATALSEGEDAPDPQQPTPDPLQFAYDSGMPKTWVEFADALDRFAAQRVAAATADQAKIAPAQGYSAGIPWSLHLRAYDAYCTKYRPQPAMIDLEGRNCRGGFTVSELDEFVPGWREEVSEISRLKEQIAALTAAAAKARREALQWHQIETAPKDGTAILMNNGQVHAVVKWEKGGWVIGRDEDGPYYFSSKLPPPKHWMPLPDPPQNPGDAAPRQEGEE